MPIRKRRNNSDGTLETVLEGQVYESTQPEAVDTLVEEAQEFSGTATLQDPLDQIPQSGVFVSTKAPNGGEIKYYLIQSDKSVTCALNPDNLYSIAMHPEKYPSLQVTQFDSQNLESVHWQIGSQGVVKTWINQRIGSKPTLGHLDCQGSKSFGSVLFLMVTKDKQSQTTMVQCFTDLKNFTIYGSDECNGFEHAYEEISFNAQVIHFWSKVTTSEPNLSDI